MKNISTGHQCNLLFETIQSLAFGKSINKTSETQITSSLFDLITPNMFMQQKNPQDS